MGLGFMYNLWRTNRWAEGGYKGVDTTPLKSRKLWMTIIGSAVITIMIAVGAPEFAVKAVGTIFITYLGAQGVADIMKPKPPTNGGA